MAVIIDFQAYAGKRKSSTEKPATGGATVTAFAKAHRPQDIALVMTLDGQFRDKTIYAALRHDSASYSVLRFAPGVTADTIRDAQPIDHFYIPSPVMDQTFEALNDGPAKNIGHLFTRMAHITGDPGLPPRLYTRGITGVHVVTDGGLYSFGDGKSAPQYYKAGDIVIEYKGGAIDSGPADHMLKQVAPLDRDARIALNHAPIHAEAGRNKNGPDPFSFS